MEVERYRLGRMNNPVRGLLHGIAAVVFLVVGLVLVAGTPSDALRRWSLLVFCLSLVGLFTTSSLYHSIPWSDNWKLRMQRLDHTMIYVLVAGTFTPIAAIVLTGWVRWTTLSIQWAIVVIGAIHKARSKAERNPVSVSLVTTQGWLAVFLLWPLAQRLPWTALVTILIGGVLYTVGMIFMVTGWPRLWPRVFSAHEAFHVLVVAAASIHFVAIARWVAPY